MQKDLDRMGEWAAQNAMKMNPIKCKAVRFTKAQVKDRLNYWLQGSFNSGSEHLQILWNNLTQRLKLR